MIAQRDSGCQVVCCSAEQLPFQDREFDAAMAILLVHHWKNPRTGLAEVKRVSNRQLVSTFDVKLQDSLWLVRDYLPEILDFGSGRAQPDDDIANCLDATNVIKVPIPFDCTDGFQAAY